MKRLCTALLVAFLAAALVGCDKKSPASTPGGAHDPGKAKENAVPPPPPPPPPLPGK